MPFPAPPRPMQRNPNAAPPGSPSRWRGQNLTPPYMPPQQIAAGLSNGGPSLAQQWGQLYPNGTQAAVAAQQQPPGAPGAPTDPATTPTTGVAAAPPEAKPSASPTMAPALQSQAPGMFTGNPTQGTPSIFQPMGSPPAGPMGRRPAAGGLGFGAPPPMPRARRPLGVQRRPRMPAPPAPPPPKPPVPAPVPQPQPPAPPPPPPRRPELEMPQVQPPASIAPPKPLSPEDIKAKYPYVTDEMLAMPGVQESLQQGQDPFAQSVQASDAGPVAAGLGEDQKSYAQEVAAPSQTEMKSATTGGVDGAPMTEGRVFTNAQGQTLSRDQVHRHNERFYDAPWPTNRQLQEAGMTIKEWKAAHGVNPIEGGMNPADPGDGVVIGDKTEGGDGDLNGGVVGGVIGGVGGAVIGDKLGGGDDETTTPIVDKPDPITGNEGSWTYSETPNAAYQYNAQGYIGKQGNWQNWADYKFGDGNVDVGAAIKYGGDGLAGRGFWQHVVGIAPQNAQNFAPLPAPSQFQQALQIPAGTDPTYGYLNQFNGDGTPNPNYIKDPGVRELVSQVYRWADKISQLQEGKTQDTKLVQELFSKLNNGRAMLQRYGIGYDPLSGRTPDEGFPDENQSGTWATSNEPFNLNSQLIRGLHLNDDADFKDWAAAYELQSKINAEQANNINRQHGLDQLTAFQRQIENDPNASRAQGIADQLGDYSLTDEEFQLAKNRRASEYAKAGEDTTRQITEMASARGIDPLAYAGLQREASVGGRERLSDALGEMDLQRAMERRNNQMANIDVLQGLSRQRAQQRSAAAMALANYYGGSNQVSPYSGFGEQAARSYAAQLASDQSAGGMDGTQIAAAGVPALAQLLAAFI